jgi:hypothetical protein
MPERGKTGIGNRQNPYIGRLPGGWQAIDSGRKTPNAPEKSVPLPWIVANKGITGGKSLIWD